MIQVQCPTTGQHFQFETEQDIPEGQVFKRVTPIGNVEMFPARSSHSIDDGVTYE